MNALLLAGGTPKPGDPLYPYSKGLPKGMIDIAGKPMVQWVLDALGDAKTVENVVTVGLEPDSGVACSRPLHFLPDQGDILNNAFKGMEFVREIDAAQDRVMLISSDVPAVTGEMVDWRIAAAQKAESDLDYLVVERSVMEASYPDSNRSFVSLKGNAFCGGDVHVVRIAVLENRELWDRIIASRKSAVRQAALLGFDTLFLMLTRRLSLAGAEKLVSKRLGVVGRVTVSPYAALAMDVDKPHQVDTMRRHLADAAASTP